MAECRVLLAPLLPLLLLATLLAVLPQPVTAAGVLRCFRDEQCGVGGICDLQDSCCLVRGCDRPCRPGYVCQAGWTNCGKFPKLVDTCKCPRKMGCVRLHTLGARLGLDGRFADSGSDDASDDVDGFGEEMEQAPVQRDWLDMFYDSGR